ncbi:hypothetical protein [Jiangella asiatica]|uniref:Uncharacterized protein n=1 Tax=Jiangella asiatica TaxID=2530372 RepID=A0A4R5CV26_9ACTN|nr:hypothetical protein [Jiangella asiatica]TDE02841.1 hypothetical protein E1269_21355 [Jiangella asiatica]
MAYRVTAGYVTVETQVRENGARAYIDIRRGAELPGDVPAAQVATLLRQGDIEEVKPARKAAAKKAAAKPADEN